MKEKSTRFLHRVTAVRVIGGILVVLIVAALAGGLAFVAYQQQKLTQQIQATLDQVNQHQSELSQMQSILAELDQADTELRDQLTNVRKGRSETQDRLASLKSDIAARQQRSEEQELTNIVKTWNDRIAKITCEFSNDDGSESTATASGVATYIDGALTFITNRHLVKDKRRPLDSCEVAMPQHDITDLDVPADSIIVSEKRDVAYIDASAGGEHVPVDQNRAACSEKPDIGDRVVTLGFPKVGSENSITVTDGIISGFEDEFYITSAKIERGNSGGAAILVKNNCFLGLPTLVVVGRIESLARILPVDSLSTLDP